MVGIPTGVVAGLPTEPHISTAGLKNEGRPAVDACGGVADPRRAESGSANECAFAERKPPYWFTETRHSGYDDG